MKNRNTASAIKSARTALLNDMSRNAQKITSIPKFCKTIWEWNGDFLAIDESTAISLAWDNPHTVVYSIRPIVGDEKEEQKKLQEQMSMRIREQIIPDVLANRIEEIRMPDIERIKAISKGTNVICLETCGHSHKKQEIYVNAKRLMRIDNAMPTANVFLSAYCGKQCIIYVDNQSGEIAVLMGLQRRNAEA